MTVVHFPAGLTLNGETKSSYAFATEKHHTVVARRHARFEIKHPADDDAP